MFFAIQNVPVSINSCNIIKQLLAVVILDMMLISTIEYQY